MIFQIVSRWTGLVLFSLETTSMKLTLEAAVKSGADLRGAVLTGAVLRGAVLTGADLRDAVLTDAVLRDAVLTDAVLRDAVLRGADLRGAVLTGAVLRGAVLTDAVLRDADLTGAVLTGAVLTGADLTGADLTDAVLTGAVLRGAVLTGADLTGAVLTPIRDDLWAVLSAAPAEAEGLRLAIMAGTIDGSNYEGACACLVGTLANMRHCRFNAITTLRPDPSRPAEKFFYAIRPGDTPETSPFSKLALEWVDQWLANMREAFAGKS